MQPVKFKNVNEFLDFLPDDERALTDVLRRLILEFIPGVKEKLSYNVPFYSKQSSICFIWPASVLWGKKKTYNGVRLGFAKGHLLSDPTNYLDRANRKYVYWKDFQTLTKEDILLIKGFLYEATQLDQASRKK